MPRLARPTRPARLAPAALLAFAVWLAPPAGATPAAPAARQVTRTILPALPGADPAGDTEVHDIDNHGRIVGSSDGRPALWHDGEVVELTGFDDDVVVPAATEINDQGQVVAAGYTAAGAYPVNYLWQEGHAVDRIELGPGLPTSGARDLNEQGQALVSGTDAAGRVVVGLWEGGDFTEVAEWNDRWPVADPTVWRFVGAPVLSGGGHVASEQQRGECNPPPLPSNCERRPVVWHDGELTALPGGNGGAFGVNSRGDVIGTSAQHGGVVWRDGQPTSLGMVPQAINDRGQIVGTVDWWFLHRAAIWEDGRLVVLGTLGGRNSRAYAINESGQVIGLSDTPSGEKHVFLWDDGEMIDLTPEANDPALDPQPIAMNDRGQVIGYSETRLPLDAEVWEVTEGPG